MALKIDVRVKGSAGSGNWGHAGRVGKRGGSTVRSHSMSMISGADWEKRRQAKLDALKKSGPIVAIAHSSGWGSESGDRILDADLDGWSWEDIDGDGRARIKDNIIDEISKESGTSYEDTNTLIASWANTSNDSDAQALSIQEAISEEFGVPLSDWQKGKISQAKIERDNYVEHMMGIGYTKEGAILHGQKYRKETFSQLSRPDERKITRAIYDSTQEQLKSIGYKPGDTIRVYRGISTDKLLGPPGKVMDYKGNAVGSWSAGLDVAELFSGHLGGGVFSIDIPISSIFSTAVTGVGCLSEGEFVLFGSLGHEVTIE